MGRPLTLQASRQSPRSAGRFRVVHLSDTHLGFDDPVRPRRARLRRGPDFFANTERALQYALDVGADAAVHTGDVFFRSKLPPSIVDKAYELFCRFADHGLRLVVLPGNHERSRMPPSLWLRHENIFVLDQARAVQLACPAGTLQVVGFPYHREARARLPALWAQAQPVVADVTLLAVHQAIEGSWVGPSREEGVAFERQPDVIAKADVPDDVDAVLAGHIHRRQVLRVGRRRDIPAIHAGSVERTSAQELYEEKGFVDLLISPRRGERGREPHRVRPRFIRLPSRRWTVRLLNEDLSTPSALALARRTVAQAQPRDYVLLRAAETHLTQLSQARLEAGAPPDVVVDVRPVRNRVIGGELPGGAQSARSATSASISSGVR